MRPVPLSLLFGLVVLWSGCDAGSTPDDPPPTSNVTEVELTVATSLDSRQSVSADRGPDGTFETQGELLLPPGTHDVRLDVYSNGDRVTDDLHDGSNEAVLRFGLGGALDEHLVVIGGFPDLIPLDTTLAYVSGHSKRSPVPPPEIRLCVKDTTRGRGPFQLILERYEDGSSADDEDPERVDVDVSFPLRTVPSADTSADSVCRDVRGWRPSR